MSSVYLVLGVVLLATVVIDLLWTTLWVEGGAGPLTSLLMASTWRVFRATMSPDSRLLTLSGPSILVLGFTMWITLLWAGWTFVFASDPGALVDTIDGGALSWYEWFYFTGYSLFTLGNGDFAPRDGVWQIVTALTTASGMLFVTLSVTYVLSVLDAVTQKRSFASGVTGLGMASVAVVQRGWNGEEFRGLELPLNTFTEQLNTLTSNHKAYPVLHYFHSRQPEQAPVVAVAVLDDALTILRFGVPREDRPIDAILGNARASVESYLDVLGSSFVQPADRAPAPPELQTLRDADIPATSAGEFDAALADLDSRRRVLLGLVESDVRRWPSENDE